MYLCKRLKTHTPLSERCGQCIFSAPPPPFPLSLASFDFNSFSRPAVRSLAAAAQNVGDCVGWWCILPGENMTQHAHMVSSYVWCGGWQACNGVCVCVCVAWYEVHGRKKAQCSPTPQASSATFSLPFLIVLGTNNRDNTAQSAATTTATTITTNGAAPTWTHARSRRGRSVVFCSATHTHTHTHTLLAIDAGPANALETRSE
ncbi:hypothetical protein LX36DRAFT_436941 [Colletotrichum falcatum]|nr:hypothetical protein LX36DRAFT_436941 [Colletotrichum falcatum]